MIFVTLGTQDKQFNRLLENVENEINKGNIKEKVVVQAGETKFESDKMDIFNLIDQEQFEKYINDCDILITHGGVGSILTGLEHGKKIIACPRLSKYKEHTNDHQLQIVNKFYDEGYILKYLEGDSLGDVLNSSKKFKPKKYISNTKNFCNSLKKELNKL